jgi:hypothetical protein
MITAELILKTYESSFGGVCQHCRFTLPTLEKLACEYFEGKEIRCRECQNPVDVWECTLAEMRRPYSASFAMISLGAKQTGFLFDLAAGEAREIDLSKCGIPEEATILDLIFTPQGGNCLPLMVHANRALIRTVGTKFWVYGRPMVESTAPPGKISMLVIWAHKSQESHSWLYLLDAFEALAAQRWWNVILPAYVAFEISLMPLVRASLERHVSKQKLDAMTPNDMSSSSAFNVMLPVLCDAEQVPRLPEEISAHINSLRKLRNEIVHVGVSKATVDEKTAGEMLCAAVFGLEYLQYVRPRLVPETNEGNHA